METKHIFKEIFRLAVRLAGLFFLCVGLKDLVVQTFMTLTQGQTTNWLGVLFTFLPVAFTLSLALWLLRGTWLIRVAYPEAKNHPQRTQPPARPAAPVPASDPIPKLSEMEVAEQKLAALVEKPHDTPPSNAA